MVLDDEREGRPRMVRMPFVIACIEMEIDANHRRISDGRSIDTFFWYRYFLIDTLVHADTVAKFHIHGFLF